VVVDGSHVLTDVDKTVFVPFSPDSPVLVDNCVVVVPTDYSYCRPYSLRDTIRDHIVIPTLLFLTMVPLYLCALLTPYNSRIVDEEPHTSLQ